MGYYINHNSAGADLGANKAKALIFDGDAIEVAMPKNFDDIPEDKALICCINNGKFEAAGYAFSEQEFHVFALREDSRPKTWLLMDKELAEKLSGYKNDNLD